MMIKFYDFSIHEKLMKQIIQWNQDQMIRNLRLGRNPYFEINKNLNQIRAKMKNNPTKMIKLTT